MFITTVIASPVTTVAGAAVMDGFIIAPFTLTVSETDIPFEPLAGLVPEMTALLVEVNP